MKPTTHQFFSPDSVIWRVDREMVLLLGGGRALLMQVAHPKVAEGVIQHSRFKENPIGRLYQTMNAMWSIIFDDAPQAQATLDRVKRVHERVQGAIKHGDVLPAGTPYQAQEPELLFWVHATLVDSAIVTYELLVGPLTLQEKRRYYDESRRLALLFGVPVARIPVSIEAFRDYMEGMIESDVISAGSAARELAKEILYPSPLVLKIGGPLSGFMTTGLLPPKLRREYGLTWNHRREKVLQILASFVRGVLPFVPKTIRIVPHARAAEKRATRAYGGSRLKWERGRH